MSSRGRGAPEGSRADGSVTNDAGVQPDGLPQGASFQRSFGPAGLRMTLSRLGSWSGGGFFVHLTAIRPRRKASASVANDLDIEVANFASVGLNESAAGRYGLAHQHIEGAIRCGAVLNRH